MTNTEITMYIGVGILPVFLLCLFTFIWFNKRENTFRLRVIYYIVTVLLLVLFGISVHNIKRGLDRELSYFAPR